MVCDDMCTSLEGLNEKSYVWGGVECGSFVAEEAAVVALVVAPWT